MGRSCRVICLVLLFWASATPGVAPAADRPNVLIVLTDDQGYGDMSCHGNPILRTPAMDALHRQSVRLTNFHVDPTCSPTRAALLTGRYSSRSGVWHTIMGRSILRRDETTLADHFARAGYRTGIFGKWHLGDNYPFRVQDRGWQESLVHGGGGVGQTPDTWGNRYFDDIYLRNGKSESQKGYCTDVFFAAARRFIEADPKRPFLCYLPTNAAHGPYLVPDRYSKRFLDLKVPSPRAKFYGMIENLDENLGSLLAWLRERKLEENTLVLFMTDNGTAEGWNEATKAGFNAGMRGGKGSVYEGGHRVPAFWRLPGRFPPRDVPDLTAHLDVLPTLLEVCGIEAKHELPLDGVSLRRLLEGKGKLPPRTLLVHSQRIENPQKGRSFAVMTQRWRLVGKELYDMNADPGQRIDVAKRHPEQVSELLVSYDRWWKSISTRFGEYCDIVLGSDHENPARLTCHDWHGENVPWSHAAVRRMPRANGFWAVEVERPGRYRFLLRHFPPGHPKRLEASRARVKVGKVEQSVEVPAGVDEIAMELQLNKGKARLQTWLEAKDITRGAFFVEVRRLSSEPE